MIYRSRPEEVDAIELSEGISLNGMKGKPGDFLVHFKNGELSIHAREQFLNMYEPETAPIKVETQKPFVRIADPRDLPGGEPDKDALAKIKAENEQTSELCCFTCHEDVKASEVDEDKNCPKCATKKQPTGYDKKSLIGVCEECGEPAFPESLKEGVCLTCRGGKS